LAGCGLHAPSRGDRNAEVLVVVGSKNYNREDLERFFESRLTEVRESSQADEVKSALLDSFIEEKLLLAQAETARVTPAPEALESMRNRLSAGEAGSKQDLARDADLEHSMKESLAVQRYLHDRLFRNVSVTPAEAEAYYKEHLDEFVRNDVVHVREILVENPEEAREIQAALKAKRNRNFAELARQYSKAPTAAEGGDLGTFQRGELPEEFEKVIFPLAPNTVSKLVNTQYGFHLFMVDEKIPAHQQRFYEVATQIHERLLLERQRQALEKELSSLREQIPVRVNYEKLDFRYTGGGSASREGISK
jgi:parvulin-like peptidyl-prolyl isomerase